MNLLLFPGSHLLSDVGLEDIPLYSFMNRFMNDSTVFVVTAGSVKFFKGNPSFEHNLQREIYATL